MLASAKAITKFKKTITSAEGVAIDYLKQRLVSDLMNVQVGGLKKLLSH
jgi:hypothetical protein